MEIKVLLVEDQNIIRQGIHALLEKERDIKVVGEAVDGRTAIIAARDLKPDVILMDISMPNMNGMEATRKILAENANIKIIALTIHTEDIFVSGMLLSGANGYLLKDCFLDEMVDAIKTVASNEPYLSRQIVQNVVKEYRTIKNSSNSSPLEKLTDREREVLTLLVEGKPVKEVAMLLYISEKTVVSHRLHIMAKLGVSTIAELVKTAIREGLIHVD
jgi:DNA-binding NarL/FixJ family response regulator